MKTIKILLALFLVAFSYQQADAYTCHVPGDSSTIQGCINAVSDGDTVLVDRGIYYENIDFLGKNILVASNYIFDRLQATVDSTIINGGGLGRVVKMQSVMGANAGITGFTITNGRAENGGGGIYCYLTSARISHNVITGDTAGSGHGGGIYVRNCAPTIDSNHILNNEAYNGGGIKFSESSSGDVFGNIIRNNHAQNGGGIDIYGGSSPHIHHNRIDSNTARYFGGGIHCAGVSSPNITENDIMSNHATSGGGGIRCESCSLTIEFNTIRENYGGCGGGIGAGSSRATIKFNLIVGNQTSEHGGGILLRSDSSSVVNNTIVSNSAAEYAAGGGIHCYAYSTTEIRNNIITSSGDGCGISCSPTSHPHISYNDVWDNYDGNFCGCDSLLGQNDTVNCNADSCDISFNISMDPLFENTTNYTLLCSSACIDAGDPSDAVPPGGGRFIDMGWEEFPYIVGDANGDSRINSADVVYLIDYLYRGGPAPCPNGAGDVNCDCIINSADVTYLIDYIFRGGPPPCGSKEFTLSNTTSVFRKLPVLGEMQLLRSELSKDGVSEIKLLSEYNIDLSAIQLEFNYDPEQIRLIEPALTPRCEGHQIYYSNKDGQLKVGILDPNGVHLIPAGEGPILTLKVQGKNLSSLKLSEAILVDENAHAFLANVVEKLETGTSSPNRFSLHQNHPNPFNPETEISYDLPNDSWVKLSVHNIRGQKVKTLVDEFEAAGHKRVIWDGTDENGRKTASGVYFYRIQAGEFTDTKKMILLK